MDKINRKLIKQARNQFHALLMQKTTEMQWQCFFSEHPYVIIPSLPLQLKSINIIPMGRPGHTEPDFIFFSLINSQVHYGVIELKRPDTKIMTIPRKNVAILTRNAQTAVTQAQQYIKMVPSLLYENNPYRHLFIGNSRYLFVIMGLSKDPLFQTGNTFYREIINEGLPGNLQILPYDYLLHNFEKQYESVIVLNPISEIPYSSHLNLRTFSQTLSPSELKKILQKYNFYDSRINQIGKGIKHDYKFHDIKNSKVVIDYTTGLIWQQAGSKNKLSYVGAERYIDSLNDHHFAGYNNWRLPTLEEVISLFEPNKKSNDPHINKIFNTKIDLIWTTDKRPLENLTGYSLPAPVRYWYVSCLNGMASHISRGVLDMHARAVCLL